MGFSVRRVPSGFSRFRILLALLAVAVLASSTLFAVSSARAAAFEAPKNLVATKVTNSSMTVTWPAVSKTVPGYELRAYSKGNPTVYFPSTGPSVKLTGLKANTLYYIRSYVFDATDKSHLSDNSLEIEVSTSDYSMPSPDGLKVTGQKPTDFSLSWAPIEGLGSKDTYEVEYALDSGIKADRKIATGIDSTSTTVKGLKTNVSYFAKVYVADSSGKRKSGSSDFVLGKTLVDRGRIAGKVDGYTQHLTASAYDSTNDLAEQVTVRSDGNYSLSVRPGRYKVQLSYTGPDSYISPWARSGTSGGRLPSEATPLDVSYGQTKNAPNVTVRKGASFGGLTVDPSGKPVREVDVTAITYFDSAREIESNTLSDSSGRYTVSGLADGDHWIRYIYSGDGFKNRSIAVRVKDAKVTEYRVSTTQDWTKAPGSGELSIQARLDNEEFRKRYKAYVQGTTKVGKTVNASATEWLAGAYPTTRATMTFQWKRDGKPISGATRDKYTLTSSDRGKSISVTATGSRYGYATGSTTSSSKKIS